MKNLRLWNDTSFGESLKVVFGINTNLHEMQTNCHFHKEKLGGQDMERLTDTPMLLKQRITLSKFLILFVSLGWNNISSIKNEADKFANLMDKATKKNKQ